jgi:O-antigen ligase
MFLEENSLSFTGKSLTSSRVERWKIVYDHAVDQGVFSLIGSGLVSWAIKLPGHNEIVNWSHNLFVDSYLRTGILGFFSQQLFILGCWWTLIGEKYVSLCRFKLAALYSSFVFTGVYGFLGFTHLPGSLPYMLFLVYVARLRSDIKFTNGDNVVVSKKFIQLQKRIESQSATKGTIA